VTQQTCPDCAGTGFQFQEGHGAIRCAAAGCTLGVKFTQPYTDHDIATAVERGRLDGLSKAQEAVRAAYNRARGSL